MGFILILLSMRIILFAQILCYPPSLPPFPLLLSLSPSFHMQSEERLTTVLEGEEKGEMGTGRGGFRCQCSCWLAVCVCLFLLHF